MPGGGVARQARLFDMRVYAFGENFCCVARLGAGGLDLRKPGCLRVLSRIRLPVAVYGLGMVVHSVNLLKQARGHVSFCARLVLCKNFMSAYAS